MTVELEPVRRCRSCPQPAKDDSDFCADCAFIEDARKLVDS